MTNATKDKYVYNPNAKYYFLSVYYLGTSPAWLRFEYQTEQEISEFLIAYFTHPSEYQNLQIIDEETLVEKLAHLEEFGGVVGDDIRSFLYGSQYSGDKEYYRRIRNGEIEMSWKEGYQEWKAGELSHSSIEN